MEEKRAWAWPVLLVQRNAVTVAVNQRQAVTPSFTEPIVQMGNVADIRGGLRCLPLLLRLLTFCRAVAGRVKGGSLEVQLC